MALVLPLLVLNTVYWYSRFIFGIVCELMSETRTIYALGIIIQYDLNSMLMLYSVKCSHT